MVVGLSVATFGSPLAGAHTATTLAMAGKLTFTSCITPPATLYALEAAFSAVEDEASGTWTADFFITYGWWSEAFEWCNFTGEAHTLSGSWFFGSGYACMPLADTVGRGLYSVCVEGGVPEPGVRLVRAVICPTWTIDCADGTLAMVAA